MFDILKYCEEYDSGAERAINCQNETIESKIENRKFLNPLTLNRVNTDNKTLNFTNCFFQEIDVKNESESHGVEKISFKKCTIKYFSIFRCHISIQLEDCEIENFIIEDGAQLNIKIESSCIKTIILSKNCSVKNISISQESQIQNINCLDAKIEKISIHSSTVGKIRLNKAPEDMEIKEGGELNRFSVDTKEDLKYFLKILKVKQKSFDKSNKALILNELKHQKQIVLAAFNQYEDERMFQELDMCLIRLRNIDCKIKRMESRKVILKIGYFLENIILGVLFGWGVSIRNVLITAIGIILSFAGLNYLYLVNYLKTDVSQFNVIFIALEESVNRFFNVNGVNSNTFFSNFDTGEQIVGVILLTIITGVLARKIIK